MSRLWGATDEAPPEGLLQQETGVAQPSSGIGHYIRLHLLEAQCGRCAICGCSTTWQESELRLVLDHIDGDASNNRRDNLRLVCPNCDSQLPTFKARNRGNGRAWRRQRDADGKSYQRTCSTSNSQAGDAMAS